MSRNGRKMKWAALALCCGATGARAGDGGGLNKVTSVEVLSADGKLAIHGSEHPSFTVFKLAEPPRLVIDLAGADVTALGQSTVQSGAATSVTAAQFDEGGHHVGRLVIALEGDPKYDVKAAGNDLLVSVGSVAPAEKASPLTINLTTSGAPAAANDSVAVPADPNLVVQRDDARDVKHAARKITGVAVHAVGGQTHVRVSTDGQVARYTLIELKDPARLAIDLHSISGASRKLDGKGDVKGVRIARHDDGTRVVLDGQGERMPVYLIERRADGLEMTVGAPTASNDRADEAAAPASTPEPAALVEAAAPVAFAAAASKEAEPAPTVALQKEAAAIPDAPAESKALPVAPPPEKPKTEKLAVKHELANIRAVDLDSSADHTKVAIAIDGAFRFEVGHPDDKTIVLTLFDVALPERLERNLDATALGGALDVLSAYRVPEKPGMVKVVAALHAPCKDQLEAHKSGLTWKFGETDALPTSEASAQNAVHSQARAAAMTSDPKPAEVNVLDDRNYSGQRVNFNVKDIDVRNLLGAIADISKKNIILADDVKGTVTIKLRNVPWDQALDIILKSKALGKEEIGNIIRVAPIERLRQEQKDAADAAKIKMTYEPLKVRLIPVNYAIAQALQDKVKGVLSERGTISVDQRTNTLIVNDVQDSLIRAEGIVRNLDTQTPEVLIESRIVEASVNFSREAGIQWGGNVSLTPANGNSTGLVFPNILQVAGAADDSTAPLGGLTGVSQPNFAVNMPAAIGLNNGGGLGFVLGSAGGAAQLNLRLSAAENSGNLKTISSPRIQTLDNVEASIGQGVQIPFSQVSAAGVNTQFIEAKLELKVTPHVTQEGAINMKISATNNQPNASLTGANGQPAISNREAKTQVLVKDGDTSVIGGIYTRQNSEQWNEVPILSRIPILGWLFKKKAVSDQRTELLIFITPHIINRAESIMSTAADDNKQ